jgi:hypothetical protein
MFDEKGHLVLTLKYSTDSSYRAGHTTIIQMDCYRDETACHARGCVAGQTFASAARSELRSTLVVISIPLTGERVGKYASLNPTDHGVMTFTSKIVEDVKQHVRPQTRYDPETDQSVLISVGRPMEFTTAYAMKPPGCCVM